MIERPARLAVASATLLLLACEGAPREEFATADPPSQVPHEEPRTRAFSRRVTFAGRVVSPDGAAAAGADIRWVAEAWPDAQGAHRPRVIHETRAGADGRFTAEVDVPDRHDLWVSTARDGAVRVARLRTNGESTTDLQMRLVARREVPIELRCREPYASASTPPTLAVYLRDEPEIMLVRTIAGPDDHPIALHPLLPGFGRGDRFPIRVREGHYSLLAPLPVGRNQLVIRGGCGYALREVDVPNAARSTDPVEFTLPVEGAARLLFRLRDAPPEDTEMRFALSVWSERLEIGVSLDQRGYGVIENLPPRRYHYGDPARDECAEAVDLASGQSLHVGLSADSCLLRQTAPMPRGL